MGFPLLLPFDLSSCIMDISCLHMIIGFLPHGSSEVLTRMLFICFCFVFYHLHSYTHDGPEIPDNFIQTGCRLSALSGFSLDKLPLTYIYNHKRVFFPKMPVFLFIYLFISKEKILQIPHAGWCVRTFKQTAEKLEKQSKF